MKQLYITCCTLMFLSLQVTGQILKESFNYVADWSKTIDEQSENNWKLVIPNSNQESISYYIDSQSGNDANDGLSESAPFRSLQRLQYVKLNPGDFVRFKRGSEFVGPFYITDSGIENKYITITDYGPQEEHAPKFTNPIFVQDNFGNCIRVRGSYVKVENLYCYGTSAYVGGSYHEPGFRTVWEMGAIYVEKGAESCIISNNEIFDCVVGVKSYGKNTLIEHNYIHDCNRVLSQWNWGPIGIWFGGDYQEARYNRIFNYRAEDPRINWGGTEGGADGGAFEIDDARYDKTHIAIHHNYTRDCQGFIEITHTDIQSNPDYRNFKIHHNISDDYQQFTAIWAGKDYDIHNNTIIRRKKNSNDWGVFNIAPNNAYNKFQNNIIITELDIRIFNSGLKGTSVPQSIISNNLYYAASGTLDIGQEGPGNGAIIAVNPMLVNYNGIDATDYSISEGSPAIDSGLDLGYPLDFLNRTIPQRSGVDIGAFELP